MNVKQKVSISWSGGKDSAFALYKILLSGNYDVVNLHTVINEDTRRVGMHGIREELIEQQAHAIGIPLEKLYLESSESHAAYEALMKSYYHKLSKASINAIVFGDIFLEDLKVFREKLLGTAKLDGLFPIWGIDTKILLHDFINSGFKTTLCSANTKFFETDQLGKTLDDDFIKALPPGVDPCGENGEFHTFVYDGPIFKTPVAFTPGEVVKKVYNYQKKNDDGSLEKLESAFWFQDLLL